MNYVGLAMVHLTGLTPYRQAWDLQRQTHDEVASGARDSLVFLLEHEPVFTAGRRTSATEYPTDGSEVILVDRGGRLTWHGPGQLVAYPIVVLKKPLDVIAYLRVLEAAALEVCAGFGIVGQRVPGRSGVWVPAETASAAPGPPTPLAKICAVGARVARGVTMHGLALNCDPDLSAFSRIIPCGIDDADVTSLSAVTGRSVSVAEVRPLLAAALKRALAPMLEAAT